MTKKKLVPVKFDFRSATKKCYLNLSHKEKKEIDKFITSKNLELTFSLNPYLIQKYQPNILRYLLLIDARKSSFYHKIFNYIKLNINKLNACYATGDTDFVIEYSASEQSHKKIYQDISDIIANAPKGQDDELIQCYEISKYIIIKGDTNEFSEKKNGFNLKDDDIQKIVSLQKNYYKDSILKDLSISKSELKKNIDELINKKIIHNFYPINFKQKKTIRIYSSILYTDIRIEEIIFLNSPIKEKIVDFYKVKLTEKDQYFYRDVHYIIVGEFNDLNDYHLWKELLYEKALDKQIDINIMSYPIEKIISELPITIGNFCFFEDLTSQYQHDEKNGIFIGNPYFQKTLYENKKVFLSKNSLKDHGFIIGTTGTGKTYTAIV